MGTSSRTDTKQDMSGTEHSVERPFYVRHLKPWSLKCFCFYAIFCAKGTAGVGDQVVNTTDRLQAQT